MKNKNRDGNERSMLLTTNTKNDPKGIFKDLVRRSTRNSIKILLRQIDKYKDK